MQVPIKIRFSKKCERCGLRYPQRSPACVHCSGLSEQELEDLKLKIREEQLANANLGKLFFYICVLLIISIVLLASTD